MATTRASAAVRLGAARPSSLDHRYLDPASSLAEVLFGLIMTLTFTLGAGIIIEDEGREGARQLLIAVHRLQHRLGHHRRLRCISWASCSIAAGCAGSGRPCAAHRRTRRRRARGGRAGRSARARTSAAEREALYARIVANVRAAGRDRIPCSRPTAGRIHELLARRARECAGRDSFPAVRRCALALRVSNAILLALLFVTGYWWARSHDGQPMAHGFRNAARRARDGDRRDSPRGMRRSTARHELAQALPRRALENGANLRADERLVDLELDAEVARLRMPLPQPGRQAVGRAAVRVVVAHAQARIESRRMAPQRRQRRASCLRRLS